MVKWEVLIKVGVIIEDEKEINRVSYKIMKKNTKKEFMGDKNKIYEYMYKELDNKGMEKIMLSLVKVSERRIMDLFMQEY